MTVHAAKGLEFSNVFIVGVEEELFPSAMSSTTLSEIEEERRLLYVAITRAKNFCMLSYASSRFKNGQTKTCSPSRFIRDIDTQYLNLCSGSSIEEKTSFVNPLDNYRSSFHSETKIYSSSSLNLKPIKDTRSNSSVSHKSGSTSSNEIHDVSTLSEGMIIEHQRFGTGKITTIDTSSTDARIIVEFVNTGTKTLLLKFARFKIIE